MPASSLASKEVTNLLSKHPPGVIDPIEVIKLLSKNPLNIVGLTELLSPWKTSTEAAAYVKRSPGTLAQLRFHGAGPAFHSDGGKIMYLQSDLDSWLMSGNKRRVGTKGRGKGKGRGRPLKATAKKSNARKAAVRG